MCGRYALSLRPSEVRRQLEQAQMPVADAPGDDEVRQSYNFAPGYHGLVYRADGVRGTGDTSYRLQAMQWGLAPSWSSGSMLKTINCRDDSLLDDRGLWTAMKMTQRCIVVAQGFYEWRKKGAQKLPHFTKRRDGQLMCFAGLWDLAGQRYTYSIITTDSNKQLRFLHDRMPVILDNGSDAARTWLDPSRTAWSRELQSLLRPYAHELECYPVTQDVGRVGNNSPSFVVPVDSAQNKANIANFFGHQRGHVQVDHDVNETRATPNRVEGAHDKAPLPFAAASEPLTNDMQKGIKRGRNEAEEDSDTAEKTSASPTKTRAKKQATRSATRNGSAAKTRKGNGSQKITCFFSTA